MSSELNFRTEDIELNEIRKLFIETPSDRAIINALKTKRTVVIQGARGVGKSFLLRVAQDELEQDLQDGGSILPVYVTFNKAGLLRTSDPEKFKHWMLAKLCNRIIRAARKRGLIGSSSTIFNSLANDSNDSATELRLQQLEVKLEDSWKNSSTVSEFDSGLGPEGITDAVEDLCNGVGISRVVLLIDEAAHVFIPEQQRQFFTLIRDLRTPYLSVKAAVYPGVTYFGDSFQMNHDAELLDVNRDVLDSDYLSSMREMVLRQDSSLAPAISRYSEAFDALAFASTGNPRILLRTVSSATPLNLTNVERAIREYYRDKIWSEHTDLGNRYPGHRAVIDWGRSFITQDVLRRLASDDHRVFIWIHRDAPAAVSEAFRLLCYSGIVHEAGTGLVATRGFIGTRYMLNIGTRGALQSKAVTFINDLCNSISVKRMIEFGANHSVYAPIAKLDIEEMQDGSNQLLEKQLAKSVNELELTYFLRSKLQELGVNTVREVLLSSELDLQAVKGIGPVRSRQMMNAATVAVLEYISG